MTRHRVLNLVVPTKHVRRKVDGVVCVITASEFDEAVYTEVEASSQRCTKRQRDREIMRGVYGSKFSGF